MCDRTEKLCQLLYGRPSGVKDYQYLGQSKLIQDAESHISKLNQTFKELREKSEAAVKQMKTALVTHDPGTPQFIQTINDLENILNQE